MKEQLRQLPKMDNLLELAVVQEALERFRRDYVVDQLRQQLDITRQALLQGELSEFSLEQFLAEFEASLQPKPKLHPVINGTGVVLHTNLGRAPLSEAVMDHVKALATGYSNLEYDLEAGRRGDRYHHLAEHFQRLTGCEDVHIVNNNASAVMLVLHALASEKEVVVSRGELVEIGGSFRIPDIMAISRAKLIEVGTTNRTHLKDYAQAINPDTALLMKVHQSNFYVEGFTTEVRTEELRGLADEHGLPIYEDLGSGYLVNLGFEGQIDDLRSLLERVDLVSISGDKLLGGPQAGIILGRKDLIAKLKKSQLTRALRVDKLTLAALEALLLDYIQRDPKAEIPSMQFLTRSEEEIRAQSERLLKACPIPATIELGEALVGGGSLPKARLRSPKIVFSVEAAGDLEYYLRHYATPIITTIRDNKVVLDLRCVTAKETEILQQALQAWRA